MKLSAKTIEWDDMGHSFFRAFVVDDKKRKKCVAEIDYYEKGWRASVKTSWAILTTWSKDLHTAKASVPGLLVQTILIVVDAIEDPKPAAASASSAA